MFDAYMQRGREGKRTLSENLQQSLANEPVSANPEPAKSCQPSPPAVPAAKKRAPHHPDARFPFHVLPVHTHTDLPVREETGDGEGGRSCHTGAQA